MNLPDFDHLRQIWLLDPATAFLNHGSFGSTPAAVLASLSAWQRRIERDPVRFMDRILPQHLAMVRRRLASVVGCNPCDLALISNATEGVNTVLRSLSLQPGDRIAHVNHAYGACINAMRSVARRQQLELATIRITLPVEDEQSIVDEIIEQLTPATRLLLLDHITSPTAIRLPVAAITARAEAMGTRVLIDGAHAPGQLELDLEQIGASWYVGNAHKWLAAAKGSALLHVAAQRQGEIEPLTISHGSDHHIAGYTPFEDAFAWTGTRDPAPWLAIPAALATLDSLHPSGLTAVRAINNLRASELRQALLGFDGTVPVAPPCLHDHMVAIDLTGWLPQPLSGAELADTAAAVKDWLYRKHRIQIPLIAWQSRLLLRASVHFHVRDSDLERLVAAMPGLREQLQQSRSLSHTG